MEKIEALSLQMKDTEDDSSNVKSEREKKSEELCQVEKEMEQKTQMLMSTTEQV